MYFNSFISEFVGTMVLILLGNGVTASTGFKKMYAAPTKSWVLITVAWGLAVLAGFLSAIAIKNGVAHLNPAVSVFNLVVTLKMQSGDPTAVGDAFALFFLYLTGQFLGAFVGQMVLNLINWYHILENPLQVLKDVSCTSTTHRNKLWIAGLYEFVGTGLLLGLIFAASKLQTSNTENLLFAFFPALIVVAIGMSLGSVTGYAINPARDFSPRTAYWLTAFVLLKQKDLDSKPKPDWKYGLIPIIFPLLAGVVVGLIAAYGPLFAS